MSQKVIKSTTFLVWQKFLADFPAGDLKNRPGETFLPSWPPIFLVLNLDQKKKEKGEIIIPEQETVNQANALWTLPRSEIKDEQYTELYKHISHDFENPLTWSHNKVEGKLDYTSLIFVPGKAPFDLWNRESIKGLKLFVQRVHSGVEISKCFFLQLHLRQHPSGATRHQQKRRGGN